MNPFAWSGPQYLLFYLALAVVLVIACRAWRSRGAAAGASLTDLTADPYRIACLRGGQAEAIRLAVFNLVDRRLLTLKTSERSLKANRLDAAEMVRRPLDRALLKAAAGPIRPDALVGSPGVIAAAADYEKDLASRGLVAGEEEKRRRGVVMKPALAILAVFAVGKIGFALSQGRSNVFFLVVLWIVASIAVVAVSRRWRTRAGDETLENLNGLVKRLRDRAAKLRTGGSSNEALLLASVLGLTALPSTAFGFVEDLFPRPKPSSGSGSSSDGGSGCGSSSSCSSGCGGGGGCGGCGG